MNEGATNAPRPESRVKRRGRPGRASSGAWLYLLPAVAVYVGFLVYPAVSTLQFSFLEWDGIAPPEWGGLDNFVQAVTDPLLAEAIGNGLLLIVFFTLIPIAVGLAMTALLIGRVQQGTTFYRVVFLDRKSVV